MNTKQEDIEVIEEGISNHLYGLRRAISEAESELGLIKVKCQALDKIIND